MMKEVRNYGFILLVSIIWTACATSANKEYIEESGQNPSVIAESLLKEQFQTGELSNVQLHAFEVKAEDKVQDYVDYRNMISNPKIDPKFKVESMNNIQSIVFYNNLDTSNIANFNKSDTLHYYSIDEKTIIQGLNREKDHYRGIIGFDLHKYQQDSLLLSSQAIQIYFYAVRIPKQFGEEVEMIWEILLDPINFNELNLE